MTERDRPVSRLMIDGIELKQLANSVLVTAADGTTKKVLGLKLTEANARKILIEAGHRY